MSRQDAPAVAAVTVRVDLYWLPLGAGERTGIVRLSGRLYEALASWRARRPRQALYHSALRVVTGAGEFAIEMAPVWSSVEPGRGVVGVGAVGLPWLGRFRSFRYEIRCWRNGVIPDIGYAVDSPRSVQTDLHKAASLLLAMSAFPTATWGLDELGTGEMWNSNSLVSWLLATSGHDTTAITPPAGGRAPGWMAGLSVANVPVPSGRSDLGARSPREDGRDAILVDCVDTLESVISFEDQDPGGHRVSSVS